MTHLPPESPEILEDARETAETAANDARRRATAYLDLWERQLVHIALEGRATPRAARAARR